MEDSLPEFARSLRPSLCACNCACNDLAVYLARVAEKFEINNGEVRVVR